MSEEVTLGEVRRMVDELKSAFTIAVDKITDKLDRLPDQFVTTALYDRDMNPAREGSLMARVKVLEVELDELRKDTFSKKGLYAILTLFAALAVGAGTVIAVLHP